MSPPSIIRPAGARCLYFRARVALWRADRLFDAEDTAAAHRILERWKRRLRAHGAQHGWSG